MTGKISTGSRRATMKQRADAGGDLPESGGGGGLAMFIAFFGIILIVAGVKGKERELLAQIADDAKNFVVWFFLIVFVGAIGISKTFRPVSNAMLFLIVVAYIIGSGKAIIASFNQLKSGV